MAKILRLLNTAFSEHHKHISDMKRLVAWGLKGPIVLFFLCSFIRRFLRIRFVYQSMYNISKTDWDKTPKTVKKLVKRLVDTVRAVLPDES